MTLAADTIIPPNQIVDVRLLPDKKLLRAGLLMLLFMTAAFGGATWNAMQNLSSELKALPVMLFVVVCILVARLYSKVDEFAAVQRTAACAVKPASAQHTMELAQVPLGTRKSIWNYWDENGTGKQTIECVSSTYGIAANVVQHLLEHYDVRWREQVATLYCDNPQNEYTGSIGIDRNQIAQDARRLKSGVPIYPVAGVWLCSDCRKRPCHCNLVTWKD